MHKALPMSALITGLLAMPGLGAAPVLPQETSLVAQAFPPVMPAEVSIQLRRLARGEKLDAYGMQGLQKRLASEVQDRMSQLLERREHLYPAQLTTPASMMLPTRTEKAAFLGVATSPAPAILREQLNLPRGVGLVVEFVDKDSPAEAAGLKKNDVLEKLDDQWLINGQQLAVLVRDKKPGDAVTLTVIHAGKSQPVATKLIEKEMAVLEDLIDPAAITSGGVAANPPGGALRVQGTLPQMVPPNMVGSSFNMNSDGSSVRRTVDKDNDITITKSADGKETLAVKDREGHALYEGPGEDLGKAGLSADLVKKINDLRQSPNEIRTHVSDNPPEGTAKAFTANRKDDTHDITLKSDAGGRHVTVKEIGGGKTIYDGPMNSDDEMKALPTDVQDKVKAMLEKIK